MSDQTETSVPGEFAECSLRYCFHHGSSEHVRG
jgi:hypothetical protein